MPFIGYIIGGVSFESFKLTLPSITGGDPAVIAYGTFIQTVINFLIIALVIFLLIKGINKLHRTEESPEEPEEETEPSEELKTLTEIRDLLKAQADTTAHADKADAEAEKSGKTRNKPLIYKMHIRDAVHRQRLFISGHIHQSPKPYKKAISPQIMCGHMIS